MVGESRNYLSSLASSFSGEHRQTSISITLNNGQNFDGLLFAGMTGEEVMGQSFRYVVKLYTQDSGYPDVPKVLSDEQVDDLLGANITVSMYYDPGDIGAGTRYFNGLCESCAWVGQVGNSGVSEYEAVLVSKMALMKNNKVYRIFQSLPVYTIIDNLLTADGLGASIDYTFDLEESDFLTMDMVVQYGESDYDFLQRLMEEHGLSYYFEHDDGKHCMCITDHHAMRDSIFHHLEHECHGGNCPVLHQPVDYLTASERAAGRMGIWTYRRQKSITPVTSSGRYYDWQNASSVNAATQQSVFDETPSYAQNSDWMVQRQYPLGSIGDNSSGDADTWSGNRHAKFEAWRLQRKATQRVATSNMRFLLLGHYFQLGDHPVSSENQEYLITACRYKIGTEYYPLQHHKAHPREVEDAIFQVEVELVPNSLSYVPDLISPKPVIPGIQSATVVYGDTEMSVDTDDYGRVLVQFPWNDDDVSVSTTTVSNASSDNTAEADTTGATDNDTTDSSQLSAYIRVSQFWAGSNRGALFTPRVGDEVLIAFEFGDPSKPMVIGSAYNSENTPFITPSDYPLVNGIRTRICSSTSTDLNSGYNGIHHSDLLFDDHHSSDSRGLSLRSFRNSAGSNYDFNGSDNNPNLTDRVAAFTIMDTSDSDDHELNISMNTGGDVQFLMTGDQGDITNQAMSKKVKLGVAYLTQQTWNTYSAQTFAPMIKFWAPYAVEMKSLASWCSVGPIGAELVSLKGSVKIQSGVEYTKMATVSTTLNYAEWAVKIADLFVADEDATYMAAVESVLTAGSGLIGVLAIVETLKSGALSGGWSMYNMGRITVRPGSAETYTYNSTGESTQTKHYQNMISVKATDTTGNYSQTMYAPELMEHQVYSGTDLMATTESLTSDNYDLEIYDGATKIRADSTFYGVSVAEGVTKLLMNGTYFYVTAVEGASKMVMSADKYYVNVASTTGQLMVSAASASLSTGSSASCLSLDAASIAMNTTNISLAGSATITGDAALITMNGSASADTSSDSSSTDESAAVTEAESADALDESSGDVITTTVEAFSETYGLEIDAYDTEDDTYDLLLGGIEDEDV